MLERGVNCNPHFLNHLRGLDFLPRGSASLKPGGNSAQELRISCPVTETAQLKANESDPEKLTRLLELELIQKRATWKQVGDRARSIRAAGFVFLFVVIVACLVGGYFVFMRVNEQRTNPPPSSAIDR